MSNEEFVNNLEAKLEELSSSKAIAFAIGICRRLLPYYIEFSEEHGWGDTNILSESIRFCEKLENLETVAMDELQSLKKQIELAIPDTEEFENGSIAMNASVAVLELVEYVINRDPNHIMNISSYMTDTIDFIAREEGIDISIIHQELNKERVNQLELITNIS